MSRPPRSVGAAPSPVIGPRRGLASVVGIGVAADAAARLAGRAQRIGRLVLRARGRRQPAPASRIDEIGRRGVYRRPAGDAAVHAIAVHDSIVHILGESRIP